MIRNVVFVILIVLMVIFVLQNIQDVEIRFLFWTLATSRALVLLMTFAAGLIGGWLLSLPLGRKSVSIKKQR